jgi:hypothetical protein
MQLEKETKIMVTNKNGVQETKKSNQQQRQGGMTSSVGSTNANSPEIQEAKQLNQQSRQGSMASSASGTASFSSAISGEMSNGVEEAKQLNEQSRRNQGK